MRYIHAKGIEIPLYRGYLLIIISNASDKVRKYIPDFEDEQPFAHTCFTPYRGNEGFAIVLNFEHSHGIVRNGTIAHEAVHAADMIAYCRGIEPDFENDEPMAYLIEWICNEVHRFVNKKGFTVAL